MTGDTGSRSKIVWIALAALLLLLAVQQLRDRAQQRELAAVPSGPQRVMPAALEEIGAIEIAVEGVHRFSRDDTGAWFYHGVHDGPQAAHEHDPDPEMSLTIKKAFEALARARIERRLEMPEKDDPFGVTRPNMIILVYLAGQIEPRIRYHVGDLAPDELSRYLHVADTRDVITLPNYQIANLEKLLATVTAKPVPQTSAEH